ncbi:LUD domain-containing protein [Streptosporangiaceae bacterium NEAU-GS5]|nr:LUD domain-containing protein [Streptosporangiaceae bacterium NEAU-GS5]
MSAREAILARIRAAAAGAPDPEIPRAYRTEGSADDLVERFTERVRDYKATVHVTADAGTVIAEALARRGGRRFVVPGGWTAVPDAAGMAAMSAMADMEALTDDPPLSARDLDAADGVITGCAVAIAETGTIVLDAGPGQGRRALTLVPDYHLCVVRAGQIVSSVPEAIARLDPARPLTWISGSSATSDIEFDRVEGVHGPRTLEVVVILQ